MKKKLVILTLVAFMISSATAITANSFDIENKPLSELQYSYTNDGAESFTTTIGDRAENSTIIKRQVTVYDSQGNQIGQTSTQGNESNGDFIDGWDSHYVSDLPQDEELTAELKIIDKDINGNVLDTYTQNETITLKSFDYSYSATPNTGNLYFGDDGEIPVTITIDINPHTAIDQVSVAQFGVGDSGTVSVDSTNFDTSTGTATWEGHIDTSVLGTGYGYISEGQQYSWNDLAFRFGSDSDVAVDHNEVRSEAGTFTVYERPELTEEVDVTNSQVTVSTSEQLSSITGTVNGQNLTLADLSETQTANGYQYTMDVQFNQAGETYLVEVESITDQAGATRNVGFTQQYAPSDVLEISSSTSYSSATNQSTEEQQYYTESKDVTVTNSGTEAISGVTICEGDNQRTVTAQVGENNFNCYEKTKSVDVIDVEKTFTTSENFDHTLDVQKFEIKKELTHTGEVDFSNVEVTVLEGTEAETTRTTEIASGTTETEVFYIEDDLLNETYNTNSFVVENMVSTGFDNVTVTSKTDYCKDQISIGQGATSEYCVGGNSITGQFGGSTTGAVGGILFILMMAGGYFYFRI